MIHVYGVFLISRAIVVEPTSLIAFRLLSVHIRFIFSRALPPPELAFCFKGAALITLASDAGSPHDGSHCQPAGGEYRRWWFVLMMGGNGGGDDEKRQNDMRQEERRSCQRECGWRAPDHCSNEALRNLFTFRAVINCLSVPLNNFITRWPGACHVWGSRPSNILLGWRQIEQTLGEVCWVALLGGGRRGCLVANWLLQAAVTTCSLPAVNQPEWKTVYKNVNPM